MQNRELTTEEQIDRALRPRDFDDYIGQRDLINTLKIAIEASSQRNDPVDHILVFGPPGLGKTSLAQVVANEYGTKWRSVSAPSIKSVADIIDILKKVEDNEIIFIDEIHALEKKIEETLYPAMEDFKIPIKMGNKETIYININPFCLIGATTNLGKVAAPLRDRFGITYNMQFYSVEELGQIIYANSQKLKLHVESTDAIINIAKRSRGTPRIANKILRRVRDYSQIHNGNVISPESVDNALKIEGIDDRGLTRSDMRYLNILYKTYNCGPCGLNPIAVSCGEDKATVSDFIEPFLIREGFIALTQRGRVLTPEGMQYILNN